MSNSKLPPSSGLPLPDAMAGNFQDAMRWFQQIWGSSGAAAGGAASPAVPSMMLPTLDVGEIEKRIADLRSVEQWLHVNQAMVHTTIQAMEMQRDTLRTWKSMAAGNAAAAAGSTSGAPAGALGENPAFNPTLWWDALQQQFTQMAQSAAQTGAQPRPAEAPSTAAAPAAKSGTGKGKPAAP